MDYNGLEMDITQKIGRLCSVSAEHIVCGSGSDSPNLPTAVTVSQEGKG